MLAHRIEGRIVSGRLDGKLLFEFTADELCHLHGALSERRERLKDRGYSARAEDVEELRTALMHHQRKVEREGFRYKKTG